MIQARYRTIAATPLNRHFGNTHTHSGAPAINLIDPPRRHSIVSVIVVVRYTSIFDDHTTSHHLFVLPLLACAPPVDLNTPRGNPFLAAVSMKGASCCGKRDLHLNLCYPLQVRQLSVQRIGLWRQKNVAGAAICSLSSGT